MNYTLKMQGDVRPVNTPTIPVVHDDAHGADGTRIPSEDLRSRRIAREGGRWLQFARERCRMRDSVAFSVQRRASSYAVPSKLCAVKDHQRALWAMVREHVRQWSELNIDETAGGALVVSYNGEPIGEVQPKHLPWVRPLVPFGCRLYLDRVTGSASEGYVLGVNVVFSVGKALDALLHALGASYGDSGIARGDGAQGTGALKAPVAPSERVGGDGDAGTLVPVLAQQEALTGSTGDVALWRETDGTARASVPHVALHSPTGVEWGYGGSGPADLARSILIAIAGEAVAGRLYHLFKHEVIARIPHVGGVIRAADVRAWLAVNGAATI
jgi:hypothetical protein